MEAAGYARVARTVEDFTKEKKIGVGTYGEVCKFVCYIAWVESNSDSSVQLVLYRT